MMPQPKITQPHMEEVLGFQVPTEDYYLHRGHAWAALEGNDRVRVGLDDFSQKLLGPAQDVKLPEVGKIYYQDHLCLALIREGKKASYEAPVDGVVEAVNPLVRQNPRLIHDDPYGEGWICLVKAVNLKRNLANLLSGQDAVAWIDEEAHRLLNLIQTKAGVILPTGGAIVDDVYGNFKELGWRNLVQEFFLQNLPRSWKKRY